ncbi:MAG TPA: hypothetical protein VMW24_17335 [Sedimentisphaerales bacterium]|nr:hypothetical protein [Sedimentisphaerales bacterium]
MTICIVTTTQCNLRCPECLSGHCMDDDMSWKSVENIHKHYPADSIVFTGGEPTRWNPLRQAIDLFTGKTRVISNGYRAPAYLYGNADQIVLSHYGAINVEDILRLRRELGRRRVKVKNVVHRKLMPSGIVSCNCVQPTFYRDKVYPCAAAWRKPGAEGRPIGAKPSAINRKWCQLCEHNRHCLGWPPTVIELRVLDSHFYRAIRLPHLGSIRARYRQWLSKTEELYNGDPG